MELWQARWRSWVYLLPPSLRRVRSSWESRAGEERRTGRSARRMGAYENGRWGIQSRRAESWGKREVWRSGWEESVLDVFMMMKSLVNVEGRGRRSDNEEGTNTSTPLKSPDGTICGSMDCNGRGCVWFAINGEKELWERSVAMSKEISSWEPSEELSDEGTAIAEESVFRKECSILEREEKRGRYNGGWRMSSRMKRNERIVE